jgi:hypothetical protein
MNLAMTVRAGVLGLLATAFSGLASAHHSTAMFSWGNEKTLEGTVSKWQWTNPHTFLWVSVKGKAGQVQEFGLEGMSPSWLARRGWNGKTLASGDKVTIAYYPLRDGRPGGFFVRVTMSNGAVLQGLPVPPGARPAAGASAAAAPAPSPSAK